MEEAKVKYTKEDVYRELGINQKLIDNEETNDALSRLVDMVTTVQLSNIQSDEEFKKAIEIYRKEIDVTDEGKRVAGITDIIKKDNETIAQYQVMKVGENDKLNREAVVLDIVNEKEESPKTTKDIIRREADFIMKQGTDSTLRKTTYKKQIIEPGNFEGEITKEMMEELNRMKEWDEEVIEEFDWYNSQTIMKYDDEQNQKTDDKAKLYRDSLKNAYNQYTDQSNKLDPSIITDNSQLRKNMLEELGVNKEILSKPELLAELDGLIEYASQGQDLSTKDGVESTLAKLRETTEISSTSVSGIVANRKYINREQNSLDVTEGVKISLLEGNEYAVENTKYGRTFEDEMGNMNIRQQSKKTIYRQNYSDKTVLEKVKEEEKNSTKSENVGENLPKPPEGETCGKQYQYLLSRIPQKYSQLQTLLENSQYVTTWSDTRDIKTRIAEDRSKVEDESYRG